MRPRAGLRSASTIATLQVAFVAWSAFGAVCAAVMWWSMRTHGHSPLRIAAYALAVWSVWAVATPLVVWLGRRAPLIPFAPRAVVVHLVAAAALAVAHHAWWTALEVWVRPFDAMGAHAFGAGFRKELGDRVFLEALVYAAVLGVGHGVEYYRRMRDRELHAARLEASLVHARLDALELQLQPHFLFNTLHAIGGLVRQVRTAEAVEMIAGLSEMLRYSLDRVGHHLVALDQELVILGRYLDIQRLRFPDRLAVTIDVPAALRVARVPALLLQPLIENAVRHGIEPRAEAGAIELRGRREGARLVLELWNSGPGLGGRADGVGIANTRERLARLYGADHAFTLTEARGGVLARLDLPFEDAPS